MRLRWICALLALVGGVACLAGTSFAGGGFGSPPPKKPSAALDKAAAGKKITFIVPALDRSVYLSEAAGAKQAQKDYPKVKFSIVAGKSIATSDDVISLIKAATVKHANVIVVNTGNQPSELYPALGQAIKAGIKVISYDSNVPVVGTSGFIGTDSEAEGVAAGLWLRQALPQGGPIGFMMCVPGHPVTEAKKRGFFASIAHSNVHIVSNLNANCDPVQGRSVMQDMLTAHPEIKAVMSISDAQTVGLVQALKALHKHLIVVSIDASTDVLDLIKQGWVQADAPAYSYGMGYLAATSAIEASIGHVVPSQQYSSGPYSVVTKANVAAFSKNPKLQ